MNVPAGGVDRPEPLLPQQARVPSVRMPQLKSKPAATAVKAPEGGVDSPSSLLPQQATSPLSLIAHE